MYPIVWSFGRINIYSHGLMMAAGAILGGLILYYLAKKKNLPTTFILDLSLLGLIGGLIGARLLYFLLYFNQFDKWYEIFFIWRGGLVSFGGFLGGLAAAAIFLKNKKQSVWVWLDIGIVGFLAGWAVGRLGCFLTADVVGILTKSSWAIMGRFPITLFESGLSLIIAGFCLFLILQKKWKILPGLVFNVGFGLYGAGRFLIDFLREEDASLRSLKLSQVGDLLVIALAIFFIFLIIKRESKRGERSKNGF